MSIMEYKRKSKIWGIHTVCCFLFDGSEEYVFRVIDYDEDILWTPDDELKSFGYGIMGLLGGLILGFLGCVNAILAIIFAIIYIVNLLKYKSLKNNV